MKRMLARWITVLAVTGWTGTVNAGLITFEEFGLQPGNFASQEPLDTEYAAMGVNFSGGWEILNQSGNFGINARSGQHFAAYNTSQTGITNTLTMLFDNTIMQASGFLGDGSQSSWTVTALLGGLQVGQQNLMNAIGNYVEFSFNAVSFDSITITGSGSSAVLDDLTFDMRANQVPAPATLALFGLGLAGLGWSRRKA